MPVSKEKETKKLVTEIAFRVASVILMTSIIIFLAVPKIKKIVQHQDKLTSINIVNKTIEGIPIPNAFVCGALIDHITVEKVPLGKKAIMVEEYLWQTDETILKAGGDLTEDTQNDPCFIFQPNGIFKFKLTNDSDSIDYISINAISNQNVSSGSAIIGAVFGLWNAERDISVIKPFAARTATINHFTFASTIRIDMDNTVHQDFTINKQNTLQIEKFENETIAIKFDYSPDSYMVTEYSEKQPYGWLNLVAEIGGYLTYVTGTWIFLFGRGKYKSWGFVQRFLLKNSPNAKKPPLMKKEEFNKARLSSSSTHPLDSEYHFRTSASGDIYFSAAEILREVDFRINEKFWFLEQTLSRHYLAGFRLREIVKDNHDNNIDIEQQFQTISPPPPIVLNSNSATYLRA
ncbi:1470_t:CDS:2 [Ambispora leptoticha]|uniref:1470_t:CDS:1 n=1 Tax=Ambispora leptoticha TaxID=144679 RepID=A0A9N9AP60_9GLOM|nr:1470_t:CDS:2 [Ambispora leptoticha]